MTHPNTTTRVPPPGRQVCHGRRPRPWSAGYSSRETTPGACPSETEPGQRCPPTHSECSGGSRSSQPGTADPVPVDEAEKS